MSNYRTIVAVTAVIAALTVAGGCATMVNERQMTLDEIVSMTRAGVGDNVIQRQLEATHSEFSLTAEQITRLKDAGVSDSVIEAMIESGETPRYFDYERYPYGYPYNYGYHYYGYPPYASYRRGGLLGRFYFYGPPYPYGIPDSAEYQRWRDYLEDEYDDRRGESLNPPTDRRRSSDDDEE